VRASQQEQAGGIGANEVAANLQRIGWGPVIPNTPHDLGTDLFVQARDAVRFDRGLFVGVQVKGGPSWFNRPVRGEDGSLIGWWYYEPDTGHFDDWVRHGLPHLLVLHKLDTRISYWVHVTAKAVQPTGQGAKILVPADQTIDPEHLDALLAVAATQKQAIPLEGSAWTAGAGTIAPAHRLRHALLVPRLVGPHRNAGAAQTIGPEEAVALLAQGRLRDFNRFAEEHAAVPGLEEAGSSSDWRWRLVGAFGCLVTQGDATALAATIDDAPTPASRTAARVAAACALMNSERHDDAIELLSWERDEATPIDQAWMLTQRARARAEIGDIAGARDDAATARRLLVGDSDDVTASAIGGAAAGLLFQTAAWGDKKLEDIVAANDTAAAWWRSQTLSWGLIDAADHTFRQWADDRASRLEFEDTVNNRLFAALMNADLSGEHAEWRRAGSLLARHTLVDQHDRCDLARQADALDELRRSGDKSSLTLAARRLWTIGPLGPLTDAARRIRSGSWTHTTASTNLALWQHAGDVLDETTATDAARYCLAVLKDDSDFAARTTPSFLVAPAVLDALAGLVRAADDAVHRDIITFTTSLPPITDESIANGLGRVIHRLRATAPLTPDDRTSWREAALTQPHPALAAVMLGLLGSNDEAARGILLARAAQGDMNALEALGDVRQLEPQVVRRLTATDAQALEAIIRQAEAHTFALRLRDPARTLAVLGSWFPNETPWDVLVRYLGHDRVTGEHKREACLVLAAHADQLPEAVRSSLRDLAPRLTETASPINDPFRRMLGRPLGGAGAILAAAVGALNEQVLPDSLAVLLTGSRQQRCDAARLIAHLGRPEHTSALVALLSDPHAEVRAEAAQALAIRLASPDMAPDPLARVALRRALAGPGALIPLATAAGVATVQTPTETMHELVYPLLSHPSARVRAAARATSG